MLYVRLLLPSPKFPIFYLPLMLRGSVILIILRKPTQLFYSTSTLTDLLLPSGQLRTALNALIGKMLKMLK